MRFYMRIANRLTEEEIWEDLFYIYQPDNGHGFATFDAVNHHSRVREFTLFASSEDFEGREMLHMLAVDYFEINAGCPEDEEDINCVHCFDKLGNPQAKIPSLQLTIEPAPRRSKLGNQLSSPTPPVPPSI